MNPWMVNSVGFHVMVEMVSRVVAVGKTSNHVLLAEPRGSEATTNQRVPNAV